MWRAILAGAVAGIAVGAVLVQPGAASDTYRVDQRVMTNVVLRPGTQYVLELPVPEIAETLGLSVNSVKTHLQRGLRSMAAALQDRHQFVDEEVGP